MEQENMLSICEGYYIITQLGQGEYAIVKQGRKGEEDRALKFLKVKSENERPQQLKKLRQEVQILQQLNHQGIAKCYSYGENFQYLKKNGTILNKVGIILELGEKGNMKSFLEAKKSFDEQISRFYFRQLMSALAYMKILKISHLDLKPDNIVLDQNYDLKITDFGFSRQEQGLINDFFGGTKPYMAPELWDKIAYDGSKADVFAAGQILFQMITGKLAFEVSKKEPYTFIMQNDVQQFWNHFHDKQFSEDFKDLINRMFEPDFNKRITPEECLEHPWTKGIEANQIYIEQQFQQVHGQREQYLQQQKQIYKKKKALEAEWKAAEQKMMNNLQNSNSCKSQSQSQYDPMIEKRRKIMRLAKFKLNNRVLKKSLPTKMIDEILIYDDPKNLFCNIVDHFYQSAKIKNIHETKYKLNVNIMENDEVKYEIQIELFDLGDDLLRVDVLNLGRDFLHFNEELQKLKDLLYENNNQELIQQQ